MPLPLTPRSINRSPNSLFFKQLSSLLKQRIIAWKWRTGLGYGSGLGEIEIIIGFTGMGHTLGLAVGYNAGVFS
jgi:hypothetical protein